MLSMADTPLEKFLPVFAKLGLPVAFLVPTPTGYTKSIMDATHPVRSFLKSAHLHDYEEQAQGQDNKVILPAVFVETDQTIETSVSLYRPLTKQGDPRIWFRRLKEYCSPCNLLALLALDDTIYVVNLSSGSIAESLMSEGAVFEVLKTVADKVNSVAKELLEKLKEIHARGYLPSITAGDPGVGDTLEHALGISRNNSKKPDYKGIELKATRITRHGKKRAQTRVNLFAKVPDEGFSYHQILEHFGKEQTPRGETIPRFQLYETLRISRANAYGLILRLDEANGRLNIMQQEGSELRHVSSWKMETLRESLLIKHPETFWIKADGKTEDGVEFFRYDAVVHTKNPNVSLLEALILADKITVDLAIHRRPDGTIRDHGMLFKISPEDIHLLLGVEDEYIL